VPCLPGWSHEPAPLYRPGPSVHVVPSREEWWLQSGVLAPGLGLPVVGTTVDGLARTPGSGPRRPDPARRPARPRRGAVSAALHLLALRQGINASPDRRRATRRRRAASSGRSPRVSGSTRSRPAFRRSTPRRPEANTHGPRAAPGPFQSLVSLADGVRMRCTWEPKSMSRAIPSSTPVTVPRPYLSWVTLSPTPKRSAGGSGSGGLNGLGCQVTPGPGGVRARCHQYGPACGAGRKKSPAWPGSGAASGPAAVSVAGSGPALRPVVCRCRSTCA